MAGTISEEDIQKVREASDIVALIGERTPLKQRGRDFGVVARSITKKRLRLKLTLLRSSGIVSAAEKAAIFSPIS